MKNYIMPQTQAQIITVGQLMLPGSAPSIKKGEDIGGNPGGPIIIG